MSALQANKMSNTSAGFVSCQRCIDRVLECVRKPYATCLNCAALKKGCSVAGVQAIRCNLAGQLSLSRRRLVAEKKNRAGVSAVNRSTLSGSVAAAAASVAVDVVDVKSLANLQQRQQRQQAQQRQQLATVHANIYSPPTSSGTLTVESPQRQTHFAPQQPTDPTMEFNFHSSRRIPRDKPSKRPLVSKFAVSRYKAPTPTATSTSTFNLEEFDASITSTLSATDSASTSANASTDIYSSQRQRDRDVIFEKRDASHGYGTGLLVKNLSGSQKQLITPASSWSLKDQPDEDPLSGSAPPRSNPTVSPRPRVSSLDYTILCCDECKPVQSKIGASTPGITILNDFLENLAGKSPNRVNPTTEEEVVNWNNLKSIIGVIDSSRHPLGTTGISRPLRWFSCGQDDDEPGWSCDELIDTYGIDFPNMLSSQDAIKTAGNYLIRMEGIDCSCAHHPESDFTLFLAKYIPSADLY